MQTCERSFIFLYFIKLLNLIECKNYKSADISCANQMVWCSMAVTHMKSVLVTAIAFYLQLLFLNSNVVASWKFMLATALLIDFSSGSSCRDIDTWDISSNPCVYVHSIYQSVLFFITFWYRILQLLSF